jgi:hypothetical protein
MIPKVFYASSPTIQIRDQAGSPHAWILVVAIAVGGVMAAAAVLAIQNWRGSRRKQRQD